MKKLQIIKIGEKEREKYNDFVRKHPWGSIHQSYEWGIFQSRVKGRGPFYVWAVQDEKKEFRASVLIIRHQMPLGKCWLYCPRGPLLPGSETRKKGTRPGGALEERLLFEEIKKAAQQGKAVFYRIEPPNEIKDFVPGFRKAHACYQPEHTLKLDLGLSEEELLKQMKPKGRYNIKVAKRHGVKVKSFGPKDSGFEKAVKNFYHLLLETTARDRFAGHDLGFYQTMLEVLGGKEEVLGGKEKVLGKRGEAKLFLAEYPGAAPRPGGGLPPSAPHPLAAIIVTFFGDTATYYYGASSSHHREVMAAYLCQWESIREAKRRGFKWYDFFGIAPSSQKNHPWQGVTEFKRKFGGIEINYPPAQEYVFRRGWYFLIRLIKRLSF